MPNTLKVSGFHAPTAETKNATAAINKPFLRPNDFEINPAEAPPMIQPISALAITKPFTAQKVETAIKRVLRIR